MAQTGGAVMRSVLGRRLLPVLTMLLMALALVVGGASLDAPLLRLTVQLAAAPVLLLSLLDPPGGGGRLERFGLALLAAIVLLPLLQLVPLPPAVWTGLPGREAQAEAVRLTGVPLGWRPLSLTPLETWRAALFLAPPAAMFLAALRLDAQDRRRIAFIVLAIAVAASLLGMAQAAGGPDGPAQLYRNSNSGLPVGFFANRNHQALLMACAIPLIAALMVETRDRRGRLLGGWAPAGLAGAFIFMVCAAATLSRAGVLLLIPAVLGGGLIAAQGARGSRPLWVGLAVLAAFTAAALLVLGLRGGAIAGRFAEAWAEDRRALTTPLVVEAAKGVQPVGGGIGSFDLVYRAAEPAEAVTTAYLNHAHNDYLELWLEGGPAALALAAGFAIWWAASSLQAWRGPPGSGTSLARAASLILGLVLLHSAVDYPIRTPAIAVLAAFCAAVLSASRGRGGGKPEG